MGLVYSSVALLQRGLLAPFAAHYLISARILCLFGRDSGFSRANVHGPCVITYIICFSQANWPSVTSQGLLLRAPRLYSHGIMVLRLALAHSRPDWLQDLHLVPLEALNTIIKTRMTDIPKPVD